MATVRKRIWGADKVAWMVDYADGNGRRQRKHFPQQARRGRIPHRG